MPGESQSLDEWTQYHGPRKSFFSITNHCDDGVDDSPAVSYSYIVNARIILNTKSFLSLLAILATSSSGCSLIFGGDQRVDNRSHDYTVVRLDREPGRDWLVLSPGARSNRQTDDSNGSPEDTGDIAFEHSKAGAIISLNSVCHDQRDASLEELSRYLLLGLNTRGPTVTRSLELDGVKALEATVDAEMSQRQPNGGSEELPMRVRAVVLRKNGCTYDLMFIARPSAFDGLLPTFERFLKGFHAE